MSTQQASFEDRIARIMAGQGTTKSTVFVGQDDVFTYIPRNRRGRGGATEVASNAGYALSFPLCLMIGFLAHVLGRYAEFILMGVPEPSKNVDVDMVVVAGTGLCLAVVMAHLLGFRDRGLLLPKILGVAGGMMFFHNLVHAYPAYFESAFSPLWVAKVTTMTEAHSILLRGISIPF